MIGARLIRIKADPCRSGRDPRSNTVFEIHIVIIRISYNEFQIVEIFTVLIFVIGIIITYSRRASCGEAAF